MKSRKGRPVDDKEVATSSVSTPARAIICNDAKSQSVLRQIDRVAACDAPVLISGETGTGKELIARQLHAQSGRAGPFVAVNCGAVTQSLAESELFGHQSGSFTGARETRAGWFEAANGGTLFLDEIGDLPQSLQVKLLRVLQEREVVRVGSRTPIPLDVRLVTATNVNLSEAVISGSFRLDLFYRLNVVTVSLPPLRERPGDILPLAEHFLATYGRRLNLQTPLLSADAVHSLLRYPWPGNIRELENVMHAAVLHAEGEIRADDLRFPTMPTSTVESDTTPLAIISSQLEELFTAPPPNLHQQLEEMAVRGAFRFCGNNQVHTAKLLGISRYALRTLLKRFGLLNTDELETADDEDPRHAMN